MIFEEGKVKHDQLCKHYNTHFLNKMSRVCKQSCKRNPADTHSQSAKFGGYPAKQGRAPNSSILVPIFSQILDLRSTNTVMLSQYGQFSVL